MSTATEPALMAVEILVSATGTKLIALMSDGTYHWVMDGMRLDDDGPDAAWVERMRTAKAARLHGEPKIQRPLGHDILLATLNKRLRRT